MYDERAAVAVIAIVLTQLLLRGLRTLQAPSQERVDGLAVSSSRSTTSNPRYVMDYSQCALHRAIASIDDSMWVDDFDWNYISPDGVGVRSAWEIAMTWSEEIRGHLVLQIDEVDGRYAVIPSYEWIEFSFPSGGAKSIAAARASSIVWRALAACRGFGGDEHPVFWKRLFDEVQRPRCENGRLELRPPIVTNSKGFFQDGVAFPRIRLTEDASGSPNTLSMLSIIGIVCGLLKDSDNEHVYATMDEILERLRPYVLRSAKPLTPIELSLDIIGHLGREEELNALLSSIQDHAVTTVDPIRSPGFTVIDLRLSTPRSIEDRLLWETTCGATIQATPLAFWSIYTSQSKLRCKQFVRRALGVDGRDRAGGVRHVEYRHHDCRDPISSVCSALPFAQTLDTFELSTGDCWDNNIQVIDLAWLAYALFHPDAASSSWRRLLLRMIDLCTSPTDTVKAPSVWTLMRKGNNLRFIMGETDTIVDGYFQATLQSDSVIRVEADGHSDIIEHVVAESQFDVCVESSDVTKLDTWVRVIVVGYGFAWVAASSIVMIIERQPGCARLSSLGFCECPLEYEMGLEQLLSFVGGQLETLRLEEYYVHELARLTPRLQSLRQLCDESNLQQLIMLPSLHTLFLENRRGSASLSFSLLRHLPRLRSLHLSRFWTLTKRSVTELALVVKGSPQLRSISWEAECEQDLMNEFSERDEAMTYPMLRFLSREQLQQVESECDDGINDKAVRDALVVLLSVIRTSDGDSAMAQVHRELIGSYLGRRVSQMLYLIGRHSCRCVPNPAWSPPPGTTTNTDY